MSGSASGAGRPDSGRHDSGLRNTGAGATGAGGGDGGRIERPVLIAACLCYLAGTGVTLTDVGLRASIGGGLPAAIELTTLLIGLGALISMPACYMMRGHITAKLLSELSPHRLGRPLGIFGAIMSLVFAMLMFGMMAHNLSGKIGSNQTTPDMGLTIWILLAVVTATLGLAVLAALVPLWPGRDRAGRVG